MSTEVIVPALGTVLQLSIATVLTPIAQVVTVEGPEMSMGTVETTHLGSTAKTKRTTIFDGGKVSATVEYDPNGTTHTALEALIHTAKGTPDSWKLVYADGKTTPANHAFSGYLTSFKPTGIEVEGVLQAEIEIEISGAVTFTAGV